MKSTMKKRTHRLFGTIALTIALAMVTGCGAQADSNAALHDFLLDVARGALAAYLL